jgi:hypothetical protein
MVVVEARVLDSPRTGSMSAVNVCHCATLNELFDEL